MMILCLLACILWIIGLTWMALCPIERDRQLSYGKAKNLFLILVAIITLPLVLTFLITRFDVEPEELMYDENMYQKWQAYPFQKDMDSTSFAIVKGDTSVIYTPKSFRRKQMEKGTYEDPSIMWTVYFHFVNTSRQNMASTSRGRIIAFSLSMLGMFLLTGLLVSLTSNFFQRRIERWRNGQIRYSHGLGRFGIVVGANQMLANTLMQIDARYGKRLQHLIVLTSANIPELRRALTSQLPEELERKIVLYAGKQNEQVEIKQLRCQEADEVFVLGEDEMNSSLHDTMNINCVHLIADNLVGRKSRLKVHVLLDDPNTYSVFQISDLSEKLRNNLEFMPFNRCETWARKVLVENKAADADYLPLDGIEGIRPESEKQVQLIIAGMTEMGMALAVQAAHIAHYPNYARNHSLKTVITFVDEHIRPKEEAFKARFHALFDLYRQFPTYLVSEGEDRNFLDIEWRFIEGDIKDIALKCTCENSILTLALCYDEVGKTISTALCLSESLYEKCQQVLAYQQESEEIMRILSQSSKSYYKKLRPFGMIRQCVDLSDKYMPLSKLVNYAYNHPEDSKMEKAMVDEDGNYINNVDSLWKDLSTANKWSNIYNSDSIPTKLRSLGYAKLTDFSHELNDEEVSMLAEVEHRRWNMEKLLMGFRPLSEEEQQQCLVGGKSIKNQLKKERMAHLDICSLARLREIDPGSVKYDEDVTRIIPTMVKEHLTPISDLWK